jgi:IS30 family transposase
VDKRLGTSKLTATKTQKILYSQLELLVSKQISDALKQFYPFDLTMQISHESIYYHIYIQPKKEVEIADFTT